MQTANAISEQSDQELLISAVYSRHYENRASVFKYIENFASQKLKIFI